MRYVSELTIHARVKSVEVRPIRKSKPTIFTPGSVTLETMTMLILNHTCPENAIKPVPSSKLEFSPEKPVTWRGPSERARGVPRRPRDA